MSAPAKADYKMDELIALSVKSFNNAYCPYSKYPVRPHCKIPPPHSTS